MEGGQEGTLVVVEEPRELLLQEDSVPGARVGALRAGGARANRRRRALGRVLSARAAVERRAADHGDASPIDGSVAEGDGSAAAARAYYRAAAEASGAVDPRVWTAWARAELSHLTSKATRDRGTSAGRRNGKGARTPGAGRRAEDAVVSASGGDARLSRAQALEGTRALLGRALSLDPSDEQALHTLARLERASGGGRGAGAAASERALRMLATANPRSPYAWHALASALRAKGDRQGARECLVRGFKYGGAHAGSRSVAASCGVDLARHYLSERSERLATFQRAAALDATSPRALLAWARFASDSGGGDCRDGSRRVGVDADIETSADELYARAADRYPTEGRVWIEWAAHAQRERGSTKRDGIIGDAAAERGAGACAGSSANPRAVYAAGLSNLPACAELWAAAAAYEDACGDCTRARELLARGAALCGAEPLSGDDGSSSRPPRRKGEADAASLWTGAGMLAARDGYAAEARGHFKSALAVHAQAGDPPGLAERAGGAAASPTAAPEYAPALRGWAQLEVDCGNFRRAKKLKARLRRALA
mmetsp:Transcript_1257/g.5011  ORF Transcript_1257/g.5011 Transcript_1257/m.5011 type:complete len:544 (-) Transcript_1257:41-1672(-)